MLPNPRPVPSLVPESAWFAKWLWDNDPRSDGCVSWDGADEQEKAWLLELAAKAFAEFSIKPR
jgi:hypothetical protein